ncbi:TPA: preprotein translocase subunit SecG [Candidatus Uhrbacteria bacterium]|jgi:preprotein translocase subunit SecG|nr:preprotein translocase subunit SecG [Candidatus Uhrbacteria bacterium]
MLETIFTPLQIILGILLGTSILLQARGAGLGATFGGEGNVYRTKRGIEKRLFQASIVLAIFFFGIALANAVL